MTTPTKRPARRAAQARLMRVINVPMRVILGLPFATPLSGRLMLLFHIGRRTGQRYRQPISYVEHDGDLLTPGGGRWTLNLREGTPVRLRLRGRDRQALPELIDDADEVERLLGVMAASNPGVRRFVPLPTGPDGRLQRGPLEQAIRYGFCIVRWHLQP